MTSKIEWLKSADGKPGYTINPVKGLCPVACDYCYARRMYKRFKWDETIRMEPDWAEDLPKKPAKVFVGSTMELFGDWVEEWMWDEIWKYVNDYPQHTFIFLTKRPENLPKVFPDNCWVGVSAVSNFYIIEAMRRLADVKASVKLISIEPLLRWRPTEPMTKYAEWLNESGINWVIIGQQTPVKMSTMPQVGWVEEIVTAADKANIPVFLKDNLYPCVDQYPFAFSGKFPNLRLRQEFPVISIKG